MWPCRRRRYRTGSDTFQHARRTCVCLPRLPPSQPLGLLANCPLPLQHNYFHPVFAQFVVVMLLLLSYSKKHQQASNAAVLMLSAYSVEVAQRDVFCTPPPLAPFLLLMSPVCSALWTIAVAYVCCDGGSRYWESWEPTNTSGTQEMTQCTEVHRSGATVEGSSSSVIQSDSLRHCTATNHWETSAILKK